MFARRFSSVSVSTTRLRQLLEAEITRLSLEKPTALSLHEIVSSKRLCPNFLLHELAVRYAKRIKLIEKLNFKKVKELRSIHRIYTQSFVNLRSTSEAVEEFRDVVRKIRQNHHPVNKLVMDGMANIDLPQHEVDHFLNSFFTSKIGTELLSAEFLANLQNESVISKCNPVESLLESFEDVQNMYRLNQYELPELTIETAEPLEFPFIQQYLTYILTEVLKNAVYAQLQRGTNTPIVATVSGSVDQICIKISDRGGGINEKCLSRVWEYMYSTTQEKFSGPTVSGFGCGLSLSLQYARYLGGEVKLVSLPNYGTMVYVYLNTLNRAVERTMP